MLSVVRRMASGRYSDSQPPNGIQQLVSPACGPFLGQSKHFARGQWEGSYAFHPGPVQNPRERGRVSCKTGALSTKVLSPSRRQLNARAAHAAVPLAQGLQATLPKELPTGAGWEPSFSRPVLSGSTLRPL